MEANINLVLFNARTLQTALSIQQQAELISLLDQAEKYPNALITRRVAAFLIGVKYPTLAVWASTGRKDLPYLSLGRRTFYKLGDIKAYIERNTRTQTA